MTSEAMKQNSKSISRNPSHAKKTKTTAELATQKAGFNSVLIFSQLEAEKLSLHKKASCERWWCFLNTQQ